MKTIDCTGDAVTGDYVFFEKAVFTGSYPNAKFSHMEKLEGLIVSDSYGKSKQQHTFTIQLSTGNKIRIKGRNLYKNGCKRLQWTDESDRVKKLAEKHSRGDKARKKAKARKMSDYENTPCPYCGCENGHFTGCAR